MMRGRSADGGPVPEVENMMSHNSLATRRGAPPRLGALTTGVALAAGLLLQPAIAGANVAPAAAEAAVAQTAANTATSASATAPAKRTAVTLEQIKAAMAEAQARRETLMKPDPTVADAATRQALRDKWGVEVYGVRQAAKGYMMDFRFRVVDAAKAQPLFDPRIKPYVLTEGTNVKLPVPSGAKVGAFRTTNRGKNITADKDYYMMFGNPDAYVKPGQKVSVVIGDFRVERLTLR